jgi:ABC-2 type transport system permease protein
MRSLRFLLEKEFRQMFRSKGLVRTLFIVPIIQLIIFPLAANYSVKNISLAVVDNDHSGFSQQLINKITSSGYFKLTSSSASYKNALQKIEQDKADLSLEIPAGFERNLVREDKQKLYVSINAIEGVKAGLAGGYLGNIVADFNNDIRVRFVQPSHVSAAPVISVASSNWYNPYLNYYLFIVPGILVTLLTSIGVMQTSFNLVKEKEIGTIEQINVTPIKKHYFILGKLIPYLLLSTVVFIIGMLVGYVFYGIVPMGSFGVIFIALLAYLFALLGLSLLLSTYADTQQQAMSLCFFFVMIFNMMSGLFTSIDSMPVWAKYVSDLFPVGHFIKVMRMIVLKGSGFSDVSGHILAMFVIGLFFNSWAVLNYHKTS